MKHREWVAAALLACIPLAAAAAGPAKPASKSVGAERLQTDLQVLKTDREGLTAARRDGDAVGIAAHEAAITDDEERVRMDRQRLEADAANQKTEKKPPTDAAAERQKVTPQRPAAPASKG